MSATDLYRMTFSKTFSNPRAPWSVSVAGDDIYRATDGSSGREFTVRAIDRRTAEVIRGDATTERELARARVAVKRAHRARLRAAGLLAPA